MTILVCYGCTGYGKTDHLSDSLFSSDWKDYEEAFIQIQNDSLFQYYTNHYQLNKEDLSTSDYYKWNNFLWKEIINIKFPELDSSLKKSFNSLFEIVTAYLEPKEIYDYSPLKKQTDSNSNLVLIFSNIKDNLFTAEVYFLFGRVDVNDLKEIYKKAIISIVYIFKNDVSPVEKVYGIISYR